MTSLLINLAKFRELPKTADNFPKVSKRFVFVFSIAEFPWYFKHFQRVPTGSNHQTLQTICLFVCLFVCFNCRRLLKVSEDVSEGISTTLQCILGSGTYHFVGITKDVPAVGHCHDPSTMLAEYRNWTIALYTCYGNGVYTVHISIECTTVFGNKTTIACGKHIDWPKTSATLNNKKHFNTISEVARIFYLHKDLIDLSKNLSSTIT